MCTTDLLASVNWMLQAKDLSSLDRSSYLGFSPPLQSSLTEGRVRRLSPFIRYLY